MTDERKKEFQEERVQILLKCAQDKAFVLLSGREVTGLLCLEATVERSHILLAQMRWLNKAKRIREQQSQNQLNSFS